MLLAPKIFAQTYATQELQLEAEKQHLAKNKSLGISPALESTPAPKPVFNFDLLKGLCQLKKVEVIDRSGKHTAKEMAVFGKEAVAELEHKIVAIDLQKQLFYTVSKTDPTRFGISHYTIQEGWLTIQDYMECQDYRFSIVSISPNTIVLEIAPQDEGRHFVYHYVLSNKK